MADYDPRKDSRYKDLFESKNSFASDLLTAMKAQTELDIKESALDEQRKKTATRESLAKSMQGGAVDDNFYERARQALAEAGDLEGALSMDSAYRNLQKDKSQEEDREFTTESRKIDAVTKLAEHDPDLALSLWNSSGLGKKYGMKNDPAEFTKAPDYKAGGGVIYHVDPKSGKLVIDFDKPEKAGSGDKDRAPQFKMFVDGEGNTSVLNMRDEDDRAEIEERNLKPYSATADSAASFEKMISGGSQPEDSGPSLWDKVTGMFGGGAPSPVAPPQAAPAPTPTPTAAPMPAAGAIKKKRHILVPKGIEQ